MILFDYKKTDLYLHPLVSAKYIFETRDVITTQTYNDLAVLRMKILWPHRLFHVRNEEYIHLRNIYYYLSTSLYTPEITFIKDATDNLSYYRLVCGKSKDGLLADLDAILLAPKAYDLKHSWSRAFIVKLFLKYVNDGLSFLETVYGYLPF